MLYSTILTHVWNTVKKADLRMPDWKYAQRNSEICQCYSFFSDNFIWCDRTTFLLQSHWFFNRVNLRNPFRFRINFLWFIVHTFLLNINWAFLIVGQMKDKKFFESALLLSQPKLTVKYRMISMKRSGIYLSYIWQEFDTLLPLLWSNYRMNCLKTIICTFRAFVFFYSMNLIFKATDLWIKVREFLLILITIQ